MTPLLATSLHKEMMALHRVCGAGVSPAWFNHNILGRRDAHTTIIRKPGGEPK